MRHLFKKKKRSASVRSRTGRSGMHPMRDWMIGLCVATFVFLGTAAVVAYDFRVQFVLPPDSTATTTVDVTYSDQDVERYAEKITEKAAQFDALRGNRPAVDPITEIPAGDDRLAPDGQGGYTDPAPSR